MKKIRINKRPNRPRRPRPQQSLQQLLSRIFTILGLLLFLLFCLIPLVVNPDIMRWLQGGDFVIFVIGGVSIIIINSMLSQSNLQPKPRQIKPPVVLRYEICAVCKQEKLLCDLYDINGRIICDECINKGVNKK